MGELQLAPIGLLLAAAMSIVNVMTDVWRKRALEGRDLFPATFWMRVAVAALFVAIALFRMATGHPVTIRERWPLPDTWCWMSRSSPS